MLVKATVLYPLEITFNTTQKDLGKIREKIIEESEKLFHRQFSKPVIFSANVDVCDRPEEVVLWKR